MGEAMSEESIAGVRERRLLAALVVASSIALVGCQSQGTYLNNSVQSPVELQPSRFHEFAYVRLYADDGELVVYGKVRHLHGSCAAAPHVDLVILDSQERPVMTQSLPLARRGKRRRGWFGAAFRTRISGHPQPGERVRLAFHDCGCVPDGAFDCGKNAAVAESGGS
jgi:hypothetical protein